MWPFNKIDTSRNTLSECCSGFASCDGKHHTWTVWKDIIVTNTYWKPGMAKPIVCEANAQERTCVVCNYRERREVGED